MNYVRHGFYLKRKCYVLLGTKKTASETFAMKIPRAIGYLACQRTYLDPSSMEARNGYPGRRQHAHLAR
jgi:hypothetical protein